MTQFYCQCEDPKQESASPILGTDINPYWKIRFEEDGPLILIHFSCSNQEVRNELGCPCSCHLAVSEDGTLLMYGCSFCVMDCMKFKK